MRLVSTLDASRAGNTGLVATPPDEGSVALSTTVMEAPENTFRRARAKAVLRPKTPEPMMRMDEGGENVEGEEERVWSAIHAR